jgi:hypothetical protein
LAIPVEVRHIDPHWADCVGGINGVYDPPIALTPAGAIVKPTLPGKVPDTTLEAVPASTAKPTLATVTPAVESDKTSTLASTGKIQGSRPNSPHVNESPTAPNADDEQAGNHDSTAEDQITTSRRPSRSIDAIVQGLPTEVLGGAEIQPIEHTAPVVPDSRSSRPNDRSNTHDIDVASKPQTDALSVLLEARSSIDAATHRQSHNEQTQPPTPPATQIEPARTFETPSDGIEISASVSPMVVTVAGSYPVTIYEGDSSVVLQQGGSLLTMAPGSEASLGSHAFSAASGGGAIVIDHSVTQPMPSSNIQPPPLATFVAGGNTITAYGQGSVVVLADGTQTLTAQLGGAENGIVVQQGTGIITLAAGQETTFNGRTLSVAQSGSSLIVDGSVITIAPPGFPAQSSKEVETASDSGSTNAAGPAGATDTVGETTSSLSTPQSSVTPENAALGSLANASLSLHLLCLIVCVWAGMGLV